MKSFFRTKWLYISAGLLLLVGSITISLATATAQPSCEWDCTTTDCCNREFMCNGGTYGGICPNACIGPGIEVPIGTPCL